jgi:hypothetical protein
MSEEAGAAPTAASAAGAVADSTMADAPPGVETAEEEAVDAEPPAATGATATAAPQQRVSDKNAAELVAAEEKRAQAGGLMGERLPEGWVDLTLNERLMEHPGIEVRSRSEFGKFGKCTTTCDGQLCTVLTTVCTW